MVVYGQRPAARMEGRAKGEDVGYLLSRAASMTGPPCRAEPRLGKEWPCCQLIYWWFPVGLNIHSHGEWGEG